MGRSNGHFIHADLEKKKKGSAFFFFYVGVRRVCHSSAGLYAAKLFFIEAEYNKAMVLQLIKY